MPCTSKVIDPYGRYPNGFYDLYSHLKDWEERIKKLSQTAKQFKLVKMPAINLN